MALNAAQKRNIDAILEVHLDFSSESPENAIIALKSMLLNTISADHLGLLQSKNLLSFVNEVRAILAHEYPQNRCVGDEMTTGMSDGALQEIVYYCRGEELLSEPQGIFGLTALDHKDTPSVTKEDVRNYIRHKICLEIYNKRLFIKQTNWIYEIENGGAFETIKTYFGDVSPHEILNSQQKEYCQHSLKYESSEIQIIAKPDLFYLNDNNRSLNSRLDTFICAIVASEKAELVIKLLRLSINKPIIFRDIKGKTLSNQLNVTFLAMSFNGKDPEMKRLLNILKRYLFDDEIPLYLFNALLEAAGQEMIEYPEGIIASMNLGRSHQRTKRTADAISLPRSEAESILKIINEYDEASSDESFLKGQDLCRTAVRLWRDGSQGLALENLNSSARLGFFEAVDYLYGLGEMFFKADNFLRAARLFQQAADLGDANAKFNLGVFYEEGHGVTPSFIRAAELYQQAADLDHPAATYNLAVCYEQGSGVTQNFRRATELYQQAADLGDVDAKYNLGVCYEQGREVAQNFTRAAELYQQAADLGNVDAKYSLGLCYEEGHGVMQDFKRAAELYQQAVDAGHVAAKNNLEILQTAKLYQQTADLDLLSRNMRNKTEVLRLLNLCKTKNDHVLPHPELALRRAAATGKIDIVKSLIENIKDIDINQPGSDSGKTALMFAREKGHVEIVELLEGLEISTLSKIVARHLSA